MKKKLTLAWVRNSHAYKQFLLAMRLTIFLIVFSVAAVIANTGHSQEAKITLQLKNATLSDVLNAIENNSSYYFMFNNKLIDLSKRIDIDVQDKLINEILALLSEKIGITYKIYDRQIVLSPGDQRLNDFSVSQQQKFVSGKVSDSSGASLPGVSVVVKGTSNGTITDANGRYSISKVPENAILAFSFVGMKSQEVTVGGKTTINVTLTEETIGLDEVVAVGYGTQKKKDIIGAVSIIDMKVMKTIPTGSGVAALQGQASGVNVISSGAPGAASQIFIRGVSSFGDTNPLILIDGVEGSLENINPNEIESMQVLKDAGLASIYGVRGSNGVIIITTKKGQSGKLNVTYDAYAGVQLPHSGNPLNLVNTSEYVKLWKTAYPSDNNFPNGTIPDYMYRAPGGSAQWAKEGDSAIDQSKYNFDTSDPTNNYIIAKVSKPGTNWYSELFKPALRTTHNLSASGGTDKAKYYFSLNYMDQEGTLIETYLKRYAARINTEFNLGKVRIGENLYVYSLSNHGYSNVSGGNAIAQICRTSPLVPVYDIAGHFAGSFSSPIEGNFLNPFAIQKEKINDRDNSWVALGNTYAEIDILKHLTARSSVGGSVTSNYSVDFSPNQYYNVENYAGKNSLSESSGYGLYKIWTNTLKYSNTFNRHQFSVLAGSEAIEYSGRALSASRKDYYSTDFSYLILGNGSSNINNSSSAYKNTLFSIFGRLDYSYNDKYLLGATIRRDGSSKFGGDSRYGIFPSISLGWRISEEAFMKNLSWINNFKIRGSYGVLGSQSNVNADNAFTLFGSGKSSSYYDISGTNYSSQLGFYQTQIGNSNTSWEKDIISNIGFDATILNNKIDVTAEYYKKSIKGLLFSQSLPATVGGASAPVVNVGDIRNTGLDVNVKYRGTICNNLNFMVGANVTSYNNKVMNIPGSLGYFETTSLWAGNLVRNAIGHPASSFFGYDVIGLFKSDEDVANSPSQEGAGPGQFKYRDVTKDGKITSDDRTFIGNPNPDFTYGINIEMNYKNFDLSAVLYGSQGNQVCNYLKWFTYFTSWYHNGLSKDLLNAWSTENPDSKIPVLMGKTSFSENTVPNSFFIENGSFLKLRSLMLGYTFSPSVIERLKINKLRLYLQAINLFQITKYSGLDPELIGSSSSFGVDIGNYPNNQREFILGVSLSF